MKTSFLTEDKIQKHDFFELEIKTSIRQFVLPLLFSLVFIGLGLFLLHKKTDAPIWVGWSCIIFFGVCALMFFLKIINRRPQLIINNLGIWDRTLRCNMINWQVIHDSYFSSINGQHYISLVIDETYEPSNKKGKWYKVISAWNKKLGFQELNIPLNFLQVDKQKLIALVRAMITHTKQRNNTDEN